MKLQLGKDIQTKQPFTLSPDLVTKSVNILARKRRGKSYLAGVLEEEFAENNIPFVVLDPMGAHFGIKSGYKVHVFGGKQGDLPLDENIAEEIADLIVSTNISCIIDLSNLPKSRMRAFVTRFVDRLYDINETPRFIFLEEADIFAPQRIFPDNAKCYEAVDSLVRRGGQKGLGSCLISQRPAVVNKDVLSQADLNIFLQITGPQDLKAVSDMLQYDVEKKEMDSILRTVKNLSVGQALFYSLDPDNKLKAFVQVRERKTFHAGATPTFKQKEINFLPVDVSEVKRKLDKIIESKKEALPEHLTTGRKTVAKSTAIIVARSQKRIIELESQIQNEKHVRIKAERDLTESVSLLEKTRGEIEQAQNSLEARDNLAEALWTLIKPKAVRTLRNQKGSVDVEEPITVNTDRTVRANLDIWIKNPHLSEASRKILDTMKEHPRGAIVPLSFFGYAVNGGTFRAALSFLKKNKLITYTEGGVKLVGE